MPISREELTAYEEVVNPELRAQMEARQAKWDAARNAVERGDLETSKRLMRELRQEAEARYRAIYGGLANG